MAEFKLAFIGTHGVGKTTLCYGLAARLKAADVVLDIVHEVARRCPLPINEDTSLAAQSWILHTQISDELVAAARHPAVLCDRSVLDNYVYLLLTCGRQPGLEALVNWWLRGYQRLIYVPIVDEPREDGMRSTDAVFQRAVDERLLRELEARELPVLRLEPTAREDWLDVVEAEVRPLVTTPQLPLL
ncbi:ATP-binding protein [Pseudenhygromyxa sp. WMMC2535]|uniref:AAA family ATPase n=1 Tax=Pseudenhygromyxa sp. WMMC2535 TaxID=2712867 RepID=UPI0015551144|nr:ATP-binding protein [Pseudenhygromyxa sp. WMMC2535]